MAKKSWYTITAATKGKSGPEILIYDEIGAWGVSPTAFYEALRDLGLKAGDKATLRINSPGGDVFAGNAIYNMLLDTEADWTIHIDGVAASMASLIATLPGAHVVIAANAFIMIHNPAAWAAGESKDMKRTAALLDSIRDTMVRAYVERSGLEESQIESMLDAETWMDADEAVAFGFADEKGAENRLAAKFDLESKFKDIPDTVMAALGKASAKPAPKTKESTMDKTEMIAAVTEANKPLADALTALATALTPKKEESKDPAEVSASGDFKAYRKEVRALAALAGFPEMADELIDAEKSLDEVRAALVAKKTEKKPAARGGAAPVSGRLNTHAPAEGDGSDEDTSDLVPKPVTVAEAFAKFNGPYAGRAN